MQQCQSHQQLQLMCFPRKSLLRMGLLRMQEELSGPLQGFSCLNHHGSTSRKEDVSKETMEAFHQGGCMKALKLVRVTKSSSLDNVEKGIPQTLATGTWTHVYVQVAHSCEYQHQALHNPSENSKRWSASLTSWTVPKSKNHEETWSTCYGSIHPSCPEFQSHTTAMLHLSWMVAPRPQRNFNCFFVNHFARFKR
ncbi:uncharacterized protein LJ264_006201 isoform 1-T1 [Porphyrio hochstetteri]